MAFDPSEIGWTSMETGHDLRHANFLGTEVESKAF